MKKLSKRLLSILLVMMLLVSVMPNFSTTAKAAPLYVGIDVSYAQGYNINWAQVATQVDFAILRVGYGGDISSQDDNTFYTNAQGCIDNGIPFGVYIYSYATSTADAASEAAHTLRMINGYDLALPVYYDLEDSYILNNASTSTILEMSKTFCNAIEAAGYVPGIYANTNWWNNYLTSSTYNNWEKWVAQYSSSCTYGGTYAMWQYSCTGRVSGISGDVDMNYRYTEFLSGGTSSSTIPDGTYKICAPANNDYVLGIAGDSDSSGANVELQSWKNRDAQKFVFTKVEGSNNYFIRDYKTGKYLDDPYGSTDAGTNLWQCDYNGSTAQQWTLGKTSSGAYTIKNVASGLVIDLTGGNVAEGTNIELWSYGTDQNLTWNLTPVDTLEDGVYIMGAYNNSNYHWDVSGQSTDNGGNFNIWETLSGDALNAQKFVLQHGSDGYYTIRALHSGKYMDIAGSGTSNGTNLIQWEDGTCENHKFLVVPNTDGSYSFVGKCNGLYVDMDGGGDPANGTNLQCWTGNGSNAQKWWAMPQRTVNDGVYRLGAYSNSNAVLDVAGHTDNNGENVYIWEYMDAPSGQKFAVEYQGDGYYSLRDIGTGRYINVNGAGTARDTNIIAYGMEGDTLGTGSKFRIIPNTDGTYSLATGCGNMYVDLNTGDTTNGNNVHTWTSTLGNTQKWHLLPTLNSVEGTWTIAASADNGFVMDVVGGSADSGANIQLSAATGSDSQRFDIKADGDSGYYIIQNVKSGRNLNVDHAYTANGTNLLQFTQGAASADNERWSVIPHVDGTYSFVSKCNGLYIDLSGGLLVDGTNIQLWETIGSPNANRKWNLNSHVHSYTTESVAATCTEEGYTRYTCSDCGHSYKADAIPALGHNYQLTDSAAANCTHVAVDIYTCDRCGHTYSQEKEIAWTDWSETPAPEGTDERLIQSRTMYRYRDYETVTSNAASMDGYELVSSRWVNSGSGSVEYASFHEGYNTSHSTYSTYHKNKVSASETETAKTVIDSDNVVGYIYWHWCYGCSLGTPNWRWIAPRSRSDLASGQGTTMTTFHAWTSSSAPETLGGEICTSGYENYEGNSFVSFESNVSVCSSQCGDTYLWFYTPIYRQTYTNQVKEFTYGRYGAWSDWSETAVEATDTRQVETKTEYRYASADSYGDHVYETVKRVEATCTEEGYTGDEICIYCGAVQSVGTVIPATGHTEEIDPAVEATCTEAGKTEGAHCSACGLVIRAQTDVPAKGHTVVVDKAVAATCTTEGRTAGSHCSVCNLVFVAQTVVPAKGHTEGAVADNGDGTHTVFCSVCGAPIRTEEHSYTDGSCVCGAAEPVTGPVYDANLIFRYNSFTMGSALNVVYIVGAGTTNYADVRAVVTKYNADGTTTEKTYSIADGTMKDSGGISTFTFDGVAAKELGDTFVAKLYATGKDGTEYYGEEKTLSLKSFLLPYTQEADSAKKDLAVALLNYGAAAQVYFNYNYDANDPSTLVNYELTADQKVIDIREASATAAVTGDGAKNVYNTVLLESKIVLYAIFNLSDYSSRIGELTAVVTNTETGETVATLPVTAMGTNGSFRFDDVSAKNTRTMFSIAIYDGETKVSQDLQWSVECMVSGCRASTSTSQAKLDLANAILAYGDYAAAYLG